MRLWREFQCLNDRLDLDETANSRSTKPLACHDVLEITQNYFQLFEVPESFELDLDALAEKYRELQIEVHPDRFANAAEQEKLRAVQLSSYLNQAYDALKSPLQRAAYLLTLRGQDVETVSQSDLGMELLMEQMQLREALNELPRDESSLPELEKLKAEVANKLLQRQQSFADDLGNDALLEAKKAFHEMQFLHKLLLEIEAGEELRLGY